MMSILFGSSRVDHTSITKFHTTVDVLRLDLIHPVISGNKWFKLKEYLKDAKTTGKTTILTFGGAYSNHLVATAAAAGLHEFKSIGIIRGERPEELSHTLLQAESYGMRLFFISRDDYKKKFIPREVYHSFNKDEIYLVNEGGYGIQGMLGASDILEETDSSSYTHIVAAAGTGTMLAGLVNRASQGQSVIGISVLKNNLSLINEIRELLPEEKRHDFTLLHDYHFGGYAKYSAALFQFMNEWYRQTSIPTDFVYTGKLFYAVNDLLEKKYFPSQARVLVIHSGGLQGNLSLSKGKLIF